MNTHVMPFVPEEIDLKGPIGNEVLKVTRGLILTILGSLCVPPAPGKIPSKTSGVPNTVFLSFVAILYWQEMASFKQMKENQNVRKCTFIKP